VGIALADNANNNVLKEISMSHQILAVFKSPQAAGLAADRLISAGVTEPQISVLADQSAITPQIGVEANSKAAEGVATGATVGGVIGAIAAGAAAVGSIAIPGVGVLVGPLVAALAGAGAGAAAGGTVGGLIGLGIPEHEVKAYRKAIHEGGMVLAVEVPNDDVGSVKTILKDAGGEGVSVH
jgi:hypothetical protein